MSLFITGGLTGPILAQPILDEYLHNTFFVVAHFHLIMAMAGVFGLFAGTYYWFPLITSSRENPDGRMMSEGLGKAHFYATFIGAYATFLPMHATGLAGQPRQYAQLTGLGPLTPAGHLLSGPGSAESFHHLCCDLSGGGAAFVSVEPDTQPSGRTGGGGESVAGYYTGVAHGAGGVACHL